MIQLSPILFIINNDYNDTYLKYNNGLIIMIIII